MWCRCECANASGRVFSQRDAFQIVVIVVVAVVVVVVVAVVVVASVKVAVAVVIIVLTKHSQTPASLFLA